MGFSLPGSSIHGIFQARVLKGVPFPSPGRASQPKDQTQVSHTAGRYITVWATREFREVYNIICTTKYPIYKLILYQIILSCLEIDFHSVQSLSCVGLFATPWTAASQASLSITNSQSLLKLMSIESVMPSSHLILCHPLILLPSIFPSIRVFSIKSDLHIRWPKNWSFSFNISPSNEHPGLISFRMDWLDLLAVQGTLKRLLQHHSSKA